MGKLEANINEALFDFSVPIKRAAFLTYAFDPAFFAETIVPQLNARGCVKSLVLLDANRYASLPKSEIPGSLHRLIIERYLTNRLFHPKVFVLTGEEQFRCIIGSANLTRKGFEANREIFSVVTEKNGDAGVLIGLFQSIVASLNPLSRARNVLTEIIAELRCVSEHKETGCKIVLGGLGGPSLLSQLTGHVSNGAPQSALVMSPYFEAPDRFDSGLLRTWLARSTKVDLYVPFDQTHSRIPRDQIRDLLRKYPKLLKLYGLRTRGRTLHAKLIALMDKSHAVLLTGSANFTSAALNGKNVEVGLLFKLRKKDALKYTHRLLKDSRPLTPDELPSPDADPEPITSKLTGFLLSAVLSIKKDSLVLAFDRLWSELGLTQENLRIDVNGQPVPPASIQLTEREITILSASDFLKDSVEGWQSGTVTIRRADGKVEDFRYVELAEDEELDDAGCEVNRPVELESFISRLRNSLVNVLGQAKTGQRIGKSSKEAGLQFQDIEARLDRDFRMAIALEDHFTWLMTDPRTVYRWRRDWLFVAELLERDGDNFSPISRGLIASKMLFCLDTCISLGTADELEWIKENKELLPSIIFLSQLAAVTPQPAPTAISKILLMQAV